MVNNRVFEIPANLNVLSETVGSIVDFIKNCNLVEDTFLFETKVILNELILNAIKHGNKEDISKQVKISVYCISGRYLLMSIKDQGSGYDYGKISDGIGDCCSELSWEESGRGMLIVRNLCEKIGFNKKGNKILILKKASV